MEMVRRSVEDAKLYRWYRCPNPSCGEEVLDIKPAVQDEAGGIAASGEDQ